MSAQLARDLARLRNRREVIRGIAAGGALLSGVGGAIARPASTCLLTPAETRGPFPADGTQGPNALAQDGIVRSDIRGSFGGLTGSAAGVPLDLTITLIGAAGVCAPLAEWGLYAWHNDARGEYSLYDLPGANYLRGLQETSFAGTVRFTTILPGCYGGRSPHIHFEVYSSVAAALSGQPALMASQFTLPEAPCRAVYARDARYGDSLANLERWPTARDFVFSDASAEELALETIALAGGPRGGFTGTARVSNFE
jgi:protocatechuate 3,4-dioxygenase beta subunit